MELGIMEVEDESVIGKSEAAASYPVQLKGRMDE